MTEFSESCKKETSAEAFISGAVSNGLVWSAAGFWAGEVLGFGVAGPPGAFAGFVFGEAVNVVSYGLEYGSCSYNNKTFAENLTNGFKSVFGSKSKETTEAALPALEIK